MRILIFGAGAVGQGVGGLLASAGHDVTLIVRPRFREALAERGLRVSGVFGEHVVAPGGVRLLTDAAGAAGEAFDLVVLAVKSYDTAASIGALAAVAGDRTPVVSMQNGYGNVELLADRVGKDRVLCARVITGFSIPTPGEVEITVHAADVRVGSFWLTGHPAAAALAEAVDAAGLPSRAVDNVEAVLWAKILYNCALNPLGAILGVHYGALADSAETRAVMDAVIDEAFAVIGAHGFPCLWSGAAAFREAFYGEMIPPTYDHRPSMLQDLEAGKRIEIDALNGAIVRLAAGKGIAAPVNETIVRLIRYLARRSAPNPRAPKAHG